VKRWLNIAIICLLIGAVLNVALTVLSVAVHSGTTWSNNPDSSGGVSPRFGEQMRADARARGRVDDPGFYVWRDERWVRLGCTRARIQLMPDVELQPEIVLGKGREEDEYALFSLYDWPFRWLRGEDVSGTIWRDKTITFDEYGWPLTWLGGIEASEFEMHSPDLNLAPPRGPLNVQRFGYLGETLPGIINWLTLAVNSIFFAIVIFSLLMVVRLVRTSHRRSVGRCPECGYQLGSAVDAGCPECGWNRDVVTGQRARIISR
jgi:hypothetical protein